jgi:hypothetical protein
VEEAQPQVDGAELREAQRVIAISNLRVTLDARARTTGKPWTEQNVERMTYISAKAVDQVSGADYARSIQAIHRAGRQVGRFFEKYDVLLTPTMACAPLPLGQPDMMATDVEVFREPLMRTIGFTSLFNARQPGHVGSALLERRRTAHQDTIRGPIRGRGHTPASGLSTREGQALGGRKPPQKF